MMTVMMRGKVRNLEFAGLLKSELRATELFANADYRAAMTGKPRFLPGLF